MPNSNWTESGAAISLVPSTTPVTSAAQESPDYLTNADKIALLAQWAAELATKTQLDTTTAGLSVSSTAYDNAVAAVSTGLIAAGAPSTWQTAWPDGTTSGPWAGIQTSLGNWWSQVATQRVALQAYISAAQASNAQAAAISAAASDATSKMNTAITTAQNLAPVVVTGLPTLPSATYPAGRLVWNTTDGQLYRSTGSAWTVLNVAAADISGTLTAAQVASLAASQITGQLTDAQLVAISAAKLTGQITGTQITNGAISTPQLAAGAVTAATIAADTITASQIAANAITASELAAGAVVAGKIAAGTIQAGDIAAATITGDKIAANAITTTQIAANTITAGDIAANTITAGQIAAGAIGATQIAANAIMAANLVVANFDNLIPNPNCNQPTPVGGWPSGSIEAACLYYGDPSANTQSGSTPDWTRRINRGGAGSNSFDHIVVSPAIPCAAGDQFLFQVQACDWWATNGAGIMIEFFDTIAHVETDLSLSYPYIFQGNGNTLYNLLTLAATAPSGTNFVVFSLCNQQTANGRNVNFSALYARRMADANLIVDGAITASKIAAGSITADMITTGTLNASAVNITNINASNITAGTLSASKVLFADGTALTTASRVQTSKVSQNNTATTTGAGVPGQAAIPGLSFSVTAASANDVFNIMGSLSGAQTAGTPGTDGNVVLYVDGSLNQSALIHFAVIGGTQQAMVIMSLSGLSAGTHTFAFYVLSSLSTATFQIYVGTVLLVQRVF